MSGMLSREFLRLISINSKGGYSLMEHYDQTRAEHDEALEILEDQMHVLPPPVKRWLEFFSCCIPMLVMLVPLYFVLFGSFSGISAQQGDLGMNSYSYGEGRWLAIIGIAMVEIMGLILAATVYHQVIQDKEKNIHL
jgi:hypothetical protein